MKKALCVSAAFFCVLTLPCLLSSPASCKAADSTSAVSGAHPALWVQAVRIFELNKNLVPGRVSQKVQELDKNGGVKSETDVDVLFSLDGTGEIKTEIVKASKDGKDITAEERKKADELARKQAEKDAAKEQGKKDAKDDSDEHSHTFSLSDTPFNPERQNDVRVTETACRDTIDGASCACYEFSYPEKRPADAKGKPAIIKGRAWIEESSGRAVKLEYTRDPLPKHVKNMLTTLRYRGEGEGSWVLSRMAFDARGAFLFFGKSIRGDFRFSDYWKYEEPAAQK
jgi:hypothetical protein